MFEYETVARLRADLADEQTARRRAQQAFAQIEEALRVALADAPAELRRETPIETVRALVVVARAEQQRKTTPSIVFAGRIVRRAENDRLRAELSAMRAAVADLLAAWYAGGSHEDVALRLAPIVGRLRALEEGAKQ